MVASVVDNGADGFLGHCQGLGFGIALGDHFGKRRDADREAAIGLRFQENCGELYS